MTKALSSMLLIIGQVLFYSCHSSHDKEIICYNNFQKAAVLAYEKPGKIAALDSALMIINRCMQCDSIKTDVVELKIHLLLALGKFKQGSEFVDSLQTSDFVFPYKRKLNRDNFVALNFESNKDTISRDKVLQEIANDLEKYINTKDLQSTEFQEAFNDLYSLKGNSTDSPALNRLIDSLKIKYPGEVKFLDFFNH